MCVTHTPQTSCVSRIHHIHHTALVTASHLTCVLLHSSKPFPRSHRSHLLHQLHGLHTPFTSLTKSHDDHFALFVGLERKTHARPAGRLYVAQVQAGTSSAETAIRDTKTTDTHLSMYVIGTCMRLWNEYKRTNAHMWDCAVAACRHPHLPQAIITLRCMGVSAQVPPLEMLRLQYGQVQNVIFIPSPQVPWVPILVISTRSVRSVRLLQAPLFLAPVANSRQAAIMCSKWWAVGFIAVLDRWMRGYTQGIGNCRR